MGAISFTLDAKLLLELKKHLPLQLFIESGTFRGESLALAQPLFERCVSIELSAEYFRAATDRFGDCPNVTLLHSDSGLALRQLRPTFSTQSTVFWLDAHWCAAESSAGSMSQCPLLDELLAIGQLRDDSIILIDDARYFLSPPPAPHEISSWPDLDQIIRTLQQLSPAHSLVCYNDILAYVPRRIYPALRYFMHRSVFDLLALADKGRDYDQMVGEKIRHHEQMVVQLKEKEELIKELKAICEERDDLIFKLTFSGQNRVRKIGTTTAALGRSRVSRLRRWYHAQAKSWLEKRIPYRLGTFNQYPGRPIAPETFPAMPAPKEWPRICLLTPSYQQAHFLERTLHSVLDQKYPNLAYGVQDGGSTDGSAEIVVRHLASLAHAESAPDNGQTDAIQKGFGKLYPKRGDIMAWLNSDDLLMPGTLAYVGAYFARNPKVDVIYGHRIVVDEHDQEIGRWFLPGYHRQTLKWFDLVPQETMFWRASCFEDIGGMDPSFHFAMDWDLLLRFERAGFRIKRVPYFLGCFRVHTQQKTSAKIQTIGEKEMALLRLRTHDRKVKHSEIHERLTMEEFASARVAWLHQLGLRT